FQLDDFAVGGSNVGSESDEDLAGYSLLDSYTRSWTLLITPEDRVHRQLRNASKFFDAVCDLAADLGRDQRLRSQCTGRSRICRRRFRSFPEGNQIDDVR